MLELHTYVEWWEVNLLTDIRGAEFSTALIFTNSTSDTFICPLVSSDNQLWQVENDEFIILSGHELFHIRLSRTDGTEILFRAPAERAETLFDCDFFYFEDITGVSYIYSVVDRLNLKTILESLIDPMISVTIENSPLLVRIDAPYLSGRFVMRKPISDAADLLPYDSIVDSNREAGSPLICLGFYDSTADSVVDFESFVALAKQRCKEVRIARYYEKCGGYLIRGKVAKGIYHLKTYQSDETYEFSPEEFFLDVAIPRLLSENGLAEVGPNKKCSFFGNSIETSTHSIKLSRDVLIITEHKDDGDKKYALEMYGQACLGIRQINDQTFLAIISKNPAVPIAELKRFIKHTSGDKYVWENLDPVYGGESYVYPVFCQLNDDIVLFENEPSNHSGSHPFEMWSISKNQFANFLVPFADVCHHAFDPSIGHMEKQILVKPLGKKYADKDPQIMIAIRIYRPKEHCDIYALLDPNKRYRVHGKAYNMLSDSVTKKPKTVRALVNLFRENEVLKQKIEDFF